MPNLPKQPVPVSNPLGTTMRIEIDPGVLHETKRGKGKSAALHPVVRDAKPQVRRPSAAFTSSNCSRASTMERLSRNVAAR